MKYRLNWNNRATSDPNLTAYGCKLLYAPCCDSYGHWVQMLVESKAQMGTWVWMIQGLVPAMRKRYSQLLQSCLPRT